MKYFSWLWCFVSCFSCSQYLESQNIPIKVQENFTKMYPGENDPDWHIDSHGYYEAHFKKKGIKYRADYFPDGRWYETETSIKKKELPEAILLVIQNKYPKLKISEIERVEHYSKGLFYDVEFKRKGPNKDVEFKKDGTIIFEMK